MKKFHRSFTLIELLVSVTIFVIVCVIVIAILSISTSSKSKIMAINDLNVEANKVMLEIKDMVEKGNTRFDTTGSSPIGFVLLNSSGNEIGGCSPSNAPGIKSVYTDPSGNSITKTIKLDGSRLTIQKIIEGVTYSADFNPDKISVTAFQIDGFQRRAIGAGCSNSAAYVEVSLEMTGPIRGFSGTAPSIRLKTQFSPKYPAPDKVGDTY